MIIEAAAWDHPGVRRLTTDQQTEVRARYGGKDEPGTHPSAADVALVLLARDDDGTPLGCSALRGLGGGVAEVERMCVVPAALGLGVSKAVLAALEEAAGAQGWTTLRLETGPLQPGAIGLCSGAGHRPIGAFGDYVGDPDAAGSLFFERAVVAAPR